MLMLNVVIVVLAAAGVLLVTTVYRERWACHWCARQNWPWRDRCWNCLLARKVEV